MDKETGLEEILAVRSGDDGGELRREVEKLPREEILKLALEEMGAVGTDFNDDFFLKEYQRDEWKQWQK